MSRSKEEKIETLRLRLLEMRAYVSFHCLLMQAIFFSFIRSHKNDTFSCYFGRAGQSWLCLSCNIVEFDLYLIQDWKELSFGTQDFGDEENGSPHLLGEVIHVVTCNQMQIF